jgi:hypothetical protein
MQIAVLFGSDHRVLGYARTVQNKFLETGVDVNIKVNLVIIFARSASAAAPRLSC